MVTLGRSLLLAGLAVRAAAASPQAPLPDAIDDRIALLLAEMTLEEKAGQMTQVTLGALVPDHALAPGRLRNAIVDRGVGSVSVRGGPALPAARWRDLAASIHDLAAGESRHGIPVLFSLPATSGAGFVSDATFFPQPPGLAATRHPRLVEQCHAVMGREARSAGVPWVRGPSLDVARQPRWPGFAESFGEDVHLAGVLGAAAVRGLQGGNPDAPFPVAAAARHFLGAGLPSSGRNHSQVLLPERYLREYGLPPFQRAIAEAGLRSLIVNPGEINGIPVPANHNILTRLLRGQMKFEGIVAADWQDIERLHTTHRVAPSFKEAVRLAIEAGVDLCSCRPDFQFTGHLVALVNEGALPEQLLDASCRRILRLKFDLGLFEEPSPGSRKLSGPGPADGRQLSLQAARESLVLLKNEDVLPLPPEARILLTGPGTDSAASLVGPGTFPFRDRTATANSAPPATVRQAMEAVHRNGLTSFVPVIDPDGRFDPEHAVQAAQAADVIVCVLAEPPAAEPASPIAPLALPDEQRALVRSLSFGKPLVVVLLQSRPHLLTEIDALADAVLHAGRPGPFGARAISDVLTGAVNPSGKLPFTYPRKAHPLLPYDHKLSDTITEHDGKDGFDPLYEFGHGLGYTSFALGPLELAATDLTLADQIEVSIGLTNTGSRRGAHVIHVYIRDLYASVAPPVRRLRAFRKVWLDPGTTEPLAFRIPVRNLAFVNARNTPEVEPGRFEVQIGKQSAAFTVR